MSRSIIIYAFLAIYAIQLHTPVCFIAGAPVSPEDQYQENVILSKTQGALKHNKKLRTFPSRTELSSDISVKDTHQTDKSISANVDVNYRKSSSTVLYQSVASHLKGRSNSTLEMVNTIKNKLSNSRRRREVTRSDSDYHPTHSPRTMSSMRGHARYGLHSTVIATANAKQPYVKTSKTLTQLLASRLGQLVNAYALKATKMTTTTEETDDQKTTKTTTESSKEKKTTTTESEDRMTTATTTVESSEDDRKPVRTTTESSDDDRKTSSTTTTESSEDVQSTKTTTTESSDEEKSTQKTTTESEDDKTTRSTTTTTKEDDRKRATKSSDDDEKTKTTTPTTTTDSSDDKEHLTTRSSTEDIHKDSYTFTSTTKNSEIIIAIQGDGRSTIEANRATIHHAGEEGEEPTPTSSSTTRRAKEDEVNHSKDTIIYATTPYSQSADDKAPNIISMEEFKHMLISGKDPDIDIPSDIEIIYEGDIMLFKEQAMDILEDEGAVQLNLKRRRRRRRKKRKITPLPEKQWSQFPIPYTFDGTHNATEIQDIVEAIEYWENVTCIQFHRESDQVLKENGKKVVVFSKRDGCWSYVGNTQVGQQIVSIGEGCVGIGTIAHEVGHVIGFWHEQSRPDSEDYIEILSDNIMSKKRDNFAKRSWHDITSKGVPYDVGSLLHYGAKYFSVDDNQTTIRTRDHLQQYVIGQRAELSFYDIKLANLVYCQVTDFNRRGERCQNDGYSHSKSGDTCVCPAGFGGSDCTQVQRNEDYTVDGHICGGKNGNVVTSEVGVIEVNPPPGHYNEKKHMKCNWIIRVPQHKHIILDVEHVDLAYDAKKALCLNFLEVRYTTRLAATGGRFCSPQTLPPRPVQSMTNEMVLLYRTYTSNGTGFKVRYRSESCGGCFDTKAPSQYACFKKTEAVCKEIYDQPVITDCPAFIFGGMVEGTPECGPQKKKITRRFKCAKDTPYCCNGYVLDDNVCRDPRPVRALHDPYTFIPTSTVGHPTTTTSSQRSTAKTMGRIGESDETSNWPWGPWSQWKCSTPFCTCGKANRTRECLQRDHSQCGGHRRQLEIRVTPCSTTPRPCYCVVKETTYLPCTTTRPESAIPPGATRGAFKSSSTAGPLCRGSRTRRKLCPCSK